MFLFLISIIRTLYIYISQQGCEDPRLFFVTKRGSVGKEAKETVV